MVQAVPPLGTCDAKSLAQDLIMPGTLRVRTVSGLRSQVGLAQFALVSPANSKQINSLAEELATLPRLEMQYHWR